MTEYRLPWQPRGLGKDRADHMNNNKLYLRRDLRLRCASHYVIFQNRAGHVLLIIVAADFIVAVGEGEGGPMVLSVLLRTLFLLVSKLGKLRLREREQLAQGKRWAGVCTQVLPP